MPELVCGKAGGERCKFIWLADVVFKRQLLSEVAAFKVRQYTSRKVVVSAFEPAARLLGGNVVVGAVEINIGTWLQERS